MNQRSQELKTQIEAIETELVKLQTERSQLEQLSFAPVGSPEQIATAAKAAAISLAERQPQLDGIMDAIALLESRLPSLQSELKQWQEEENKNALRVTVDELEPQMLEASHRINQLSSELETVCEQYRHLALQYNRTRSELASQQVFPIAMTVTGLPWVVSQIGRGFSLRLGMKKLGEAIAFEQQPQPYVPTPEYSTPIDTRIDLLKSSLAGLKNHRQTVPDWDLARIAMVEGQIRETERQLREIEQQEEATKA